MKDQVLVSGGSNIWPYGSGVNFVSKALKLYNVLLKKRKL